jgi:hypothetical protein
MLLTPCGNPRPVPRSADSGYGPADAYHDGANSYAAGEPIALAVEWPADLRSEWTRGYKIARKRDRFYSTIKARRERAAS